MGYSPYMGVGIRAPRAALDRAETATALDAVAEPVQKAISRVVTGRLRDFLNGVWLGHPLHPVLVQVPIGTWVSACVLDALPGDGPASTVLVGTGTAAAVPAIMAGWADWAGLAPEQRRVGLVHAGANAIAVGLQVASLASRLSGRARPGRWLSLAAITLASAGAFIGGHLSYRQAVGVSHAAPQLRHIPEGWHQVCDLDDLTTGKPVVRNAGEVAVLLVRDHAGVTAMIAACAHEGGPLGDGTVTDIAGAECVVCPWHGSAFRLSDGAVARGPAATDQPLLRSRVRDGHVEIAVP
jgi:nitrite reductase/ring-hydroxylating ferredoxin subunit/uncharacterized membrane protein